MSNLLSMTVAGSVIVGLLLLIRPVTAKIFSARWQYRIGKMAIFFFLVPVSFFAKKLYSILPQTTTPSNYSETSPMTIPLVDEVDSLLKRQLPMTMERNLSFEVMQTILCFWAVGAIVFALWHCYCYRRFIKQLRANSIPAPENTATLLSSCQAALKIPGKIKLMQNSEIASPMLVGLRHPIILLPTSNMQGIDLRLVLTHELTHLKRKDLWVKMFALAVGTLHWLNPFAYILRKDISRWSELSCDELLAIDMSHGERKLYGEAILNTLYIHSNINTTFCSSFCERKKHIERRLTMILNAKKMNMYTAILAAVAILAIGGAGMVFAANTAENVDNNVVASDIAEPQSDISIEKELTKSKQVMNVDISSLESGEFVCLGEYTLEEGDLIAYNLEAEGDGNINGAFYKTSPSNGEGYLGNLMYSGNAIIERAFNFEVNAKLAGTYYLWIGNYEGATLENVKGTVEIAVKR